MKQRGKILTLILLTTVLFSCRKEFNEKYEKPDWLVGTVYDQLSKTIEGSSEQTSTSLFAEAIDSLGLRDKLSKGAWTFFVPSDSAVQIYLSQRGVSSLMQLPREELNRIVLYHLFKYSYNDYQLLNLNLSQYNYTPDVIASFSGQMWRFLTQCTDANSAEKSVNDTVTREIAGLPKTVPLFSTEYFNNIAKCDASSNYGYFFPSSVWSGLNLSSAKIIKKNVVCDNGYIHIIDKVVEPLPNLRQIIATDPDYSLFYHILSRFATYSINSGATAARPNGGDINNDGVIDYLYNINYSGITYNPGNELSSGNDLISSYTLCPPCNDALSQYLQNTVLNYYNNIDSAPLSFFKPLVLAHLASSVNWPAHINANKAYNSNNELIQFNTGTDVKTKAMASNGLMYGLNKVLVPNYHKSLAGQLLDPSYSIFIKALEQSGVLTNNLQNLANDYTVFVPTNELLNDSGIVYDPALKQIKYPDPVSKLLTPLTGYNLQQFVQNYIAKGKYGNLSETKYLATINNKVIKVVDNQTIQAGGNIEDNEMITLTKVSTQSENGDIYLVSKLLKQPKGNLGYYLKNRFSSFFTLMSDAGLVATSTSSTATDYNRYTIGALFSSNSMSTIFAPTDAAVGLQSFPTTVEKERFCRYLMLNNINIIPGDNYSGVSFNTVLRDAVASGPGFTVLAKLKLNTVSDILHLINNTGIQDVTATDDLIITSNGVIRTIANDQIISFEGN
jgi:uncharacterized surface protein with fasciclin (FAS1) repeats